MLKWHSAWGDTLQKMELLLADPRKFAWKYGDIYDVESEEQKRIRKVQKRVVDTFATIGIVFGACYLAMGFSVAVVALPLWIIECLDGLLHHAN